MLGGARPGAASACKAENCIQQFAEMKRFSSKGFYVSI